MTVILFFLLHFVVGTAIGGGASVIFGIVVVVAFVLGVVEFAVGVVIGV